MRLLNCSSRQLQDFILDAGIPPYAILSHTWGVDEVTLQMWQSMPLAELECKQGYRKILYCCLQALVDGLEWAWVDTCCIDRTSSAELSEAINSMFQWYSHASVCYAYLADTSSRICDDAWTLKTGLHQSQWFTRGWTLQELIGPRNLVFYSQTWQRLGTKDDLSDAVSAITGICIDYLGGRSLDSASVGMKMSWAAHRHTSQVEDMAYCMLGIFDVNMPIVYGEGSKAFRRLQEEIVKAYPGDHTLFAWGTVVNSLSQPIEDPGQLLGDKDVDWTAAQEAGQRIYGLFADSPRDFAYTGDMVPWVDAHRFFSHRQAQAQAPAVVGACVQIGLPTLSMPLTYTARRWTQPDVLQIREVTYAILLCDRATSQGSRRAAAVLALVGCGHDQVGRTRELVASTGAYHELFRRSQAREWLATRLVVGAPSPLQTRAARGDVVLRRLIGGAANQYRGCYWDLGFSPDVQAGLVRARLADHAARAIFVYAMEGGTRGFGIVLQRGGGGGETSTSMSRSNSTMLTSASTAPVWRPQDPLSISLVMLNMAPRAGATAAAPDHVAERNVTWYDCRLGLGLLDVTPALTRAVALPSDAWAVEDERLPRVAVKAERVLLDGDAARPVDVLDIVMRPAEAG